MDDAQVNQFITRLEGVLSSSSQQQGSQITSLSQQINALVATIKESSSSGQSQANASEFVKVLNANFDRSITQPKKSLREKPQKVYIAGISGNASGALGGGGGDARTPQGKFFKDMVDAIPIIGPALVGSFGIFKTISSFLLSPSNLLALGGMGAALTGLYKVFQSDGAKEFLGKGYSTIRGFLEKSIGKFLNFITGGGMGEENVAQFFDKVESGFRDLKTKIFDEYLPAIGSWWSGLMEKFKDSEFGKPIYDTAVKIIDSVKTAWSFLFGDGKGSQGIFAKLGNFFGLMGGAFVLLVDQFDEANIKTWTDKGKSFITTLTEGWESVKGFVKEVQDGFNNFIDNAEKSLGVKGIDGIMGAVGTIIGDIVKSMSRLPIVMNGILDALKDLPIIGDKIKAAEMAQGRPEAIARARAKAEASVNNPGRRSKLREAIDTKDADEQLALLIKERERLKNTMQTSSDNLQEVEANSKKMSRFLPGGVTSEQVERAKTMDAALQANFALKLRSIDERIEGLKPITVEDFAYFPKTDKLLKFHPDDVISGKKKMPQSSNLVNLNTSDLTLDAKQDGLLTRLLAENNEKLTHMIEELQQINQGVRETPPSVSVNTTQNNMSYQDIPASQQQRAFGEILSPAGSLA